MNSLRVFGRHLRDAGRNLFRNSWMTIATMLTMTVTLMVIGGLMTLMVNVDNIITDIEQGVQINVYVDPVASEEDETELIQSIHEIDRVVNIDYRSAEDEYQMLVEQYGDTFELFEGDANPFYNRLIVSVEDPQYLDEVLAQIEEKQFIVEATYGELNAENILRITEIVRIVMALMAAILVVVAILLISNTIRLTIYSRGTEIEIMRLVGAKNSYIQAPFILEGVFIGFISALIASGLTYLVYQGIQTLTFELFGLHIIRYQPAFPMLIIIAIVLVVIGVLLGIFGARRSIKRFLTI